MSAVGSWAILPDCIKRKPPFPPCALVVQRSNHRMCGAAAGCAAALGSGGNAAFLRM